MYHQRGNLIKCTYYDETKKWVRDSYIILAKESKKGGKDQITIQSSKTPDPGYLKSSHSGPSQRQGTDRSLTPGPSLSLRPDQSHVIKEETIALNRDWVYNKTVA